MLIHATFDDEEFKWQVFPVTVVCTPEDRIREIGRSLEFRRKMLNEASASFEALLVGTRQLLETSLHHYCHAS